MKQRIKMINLITFNYLYDLIEGLWKEAYDANTKERFEYLKESLEEFRKMISAFEKNKYSSLCDEFDKIIEAINFKHLNRESNWENFEIFKNDFGAYEDHDSDLLPK